jgi:hypothetical protein
MGQLELIGGQLHAGRIFLDNGGWWNAARGAMQQGGIVTVDGDVEIQDTTYTLAGGQLTADRLVMGDPTVLPSFGVSRSPEFVQTGGTVQLLNSLEMCAPFIISDPIFGEILPPPPFTDITYRLEAGTLTVDGNAVVGSAGVAPVRFFQSGGSNSVAGMLKLEGEASRYEISGGEFRVGALLVGLNFDNDGGTFAITSPAARVTIDQQISLGAEAVLETAAGASLKLDGAALEIMGDDPIRMSGLENLSLVVTGGDETSTLEAASRDMGQASWAFINNFAIDALTIGGESAGHLQLIDVFDNHSESDELEAVYVHRLFVGAGSTLDLGDVNLYYGVADIQGDVVATTGAMLALVPEPASCCLIALAVLACSWRRRVAGRRVGGPE